MNGKLLAPGDVAFDPPETQADIESDYAVLHPLRPLLLAGTLTWVNEALAGGVVWWLLIPYAPNANLMFWVFGAGLYLTIWAVLIVLMAFQKPSAKEEVLIWGRVARFIIAGAHIVIVWLIWMLFPYCPQGVRTLLAAMIMCNSPAQIICSPENVTFNRAGIIATNGSLVLWFTIFGEPVEWAFAIFAGFFGLLQFIFCDIARNATRETVAARLESDEGARKLEIALAAVAASRDAKTQFIAAASHDLGQPLQAASLFFDQTLRAPDAAMRNQAADGVRKAFASADLLLSHMLNHLRLEADAVDPHYSRMAVGQVIARVAAQFGPAAQAAGIKITVVRSSARLRIDRVLLERALGNLINNAVHHSGGTRLLIGARRGPPGTLRIWVIDNGVGIARIDGERIFEDYYRGSDSRAAVKSGFGLGLSSVRRIATLMHGEAGLDTRWLNGSAFYLDFPTQIPAKEARS
jgi:signal transduction histidine kinase